MSSLKLGGLLVCVLLLGGCTRVETTAVGSGNPWTHHGVLRIANLSEPDSLNPVVGNQQIDTDLSMFWAGYLFNLNDKDEFVPELATEVPSLQNGGISADGKTITYKLRAGVNWHDGKPFGADDVIFTWHAVMNPKNNIPSRTGYELITTIDKRDEHTIVVHLKRSFAPFIATFFTMSSTTYPILPQHLLAQFPDINRLPYNVQPVGTGPFTIDHWKRGSRIVFRANPNYWRGAPKLKQITYAPIPDENTILTQLKTHEVDLEFNAPSANYASLKEIPGTKLTLTPYVAYDQIGFNLKNSILTDVRVRRALAHATDTKKLIQDVTHGTGIPGDGDQPAFLWAHDKDLKGYEFDPAKARALLDEAGWKVGPDGVRVKDQKRLSITLAGTTGNATGIAVETLVQRWWRDVGVDAQIKNYVTSVFFASYGAGGIVQTGKYDAAFYAWYNGIDPDDSTLFMCDQRPPAGQNTYLLCDPSLDAAERTALSSNDRVVRKKAYDTIQERLVDQLPFLPTWFVRRIDIYNTDFKNYRPTHAVTNFWNSWEWEI